MLLSLARSPVVVGEVHTAWTELVLPSQKVDRILVRAHIHIHVHHSPIQIPKQIPHLISIKQLTFPSVRPPVGTHGGWEGQ